MAEHSRTDGFRRLESRKWKELAMYEIVATTAHLDGIVNTMRKGSKVRYQARRNAAGYERISQLFSTAELARDWIERDSLNRFTA